MQGALFSVCCVCAPCEILLTGPLSRLCSIIYVLCNTSTNYVFNGAWNNLEKPLDYMINVSKRILKPGNLLCITVSYLNKMDRGRLIFVRSPDPKSVFKALSNEHRCFK